MFKLQGVARNAGWGGMVLLSPENVAYATGFVVPSQPLIRGQHAACIIPSDGDPRMVVVDMEAKTVRDRLASTLVHEYGEFTDDPMASIAAAIAEPGLSNAEIGLESGYLPADDDTRLRSASPGSAFISCDKAVAQARTIQDATREAAASCAQRTHRRHDLRNMTPSDR